MSISNQGVAITLREYNLIDFVPNGVGRWRFKIPDTFPGAPKAPYYTNLRDLRSWPASIGYVAQAYEEVIERSEEKLDLISDIPLAITPVVTLVSVRMQIPMISPRLDVKTHGLQRAIDGIWAPGQRVGILDDVRTTGGSKEEVINLYRSQGLVPAAIYVLIDYDSLGTSVNGVRVVPVWRWEDLLGFYREKGEITSRVYEASMSYRRRLQEYIDGHPTA